MKSNRWIVGFLICGAALLLLGATVVVKISQFPQVTTPGTNDLFLLASGATNKNIKYSDLKAAIGGSGNVTNTYNTINVTNLTVLNSVTILNSLTTSNFYTVNGNHNTLYVSNSITIQTNGVLTLNFLPRPSVLVLGTNGNVTNATLSGLSLGNDNTLKPTGLYRDQSIEAGAMFAGPTAATTGTYTNTVNDTLSDSWTFADAATQSARFSLTLPDLWNLGTVKLKLYVTCDGTNVAGSTNLVWGVKAGSLAPLEALTNAIFGTQVFVTNGLDTAGNVMQLFTTPAITIGGSPAAGDAIWFDVSRQGSNASDTWTNTPVRLLKARVQWLESSTATSSW